jgi:predicted nucleic acid-binding protein
LGRLAEKYGYEQIGRARLSNDALIVTSAGRAGITVITMNQRDFGRLAEFSPFQWRTGVI